MKYAIIRNGKVADKDYEFAKKIIDENIDGNILLKD